MLDWKFSLFAAVVGCPHRVNPSHYFIPSLGPHKCHPYCAPPMELVRYPNAMCKQSTVRRGSKSQGRPAYHLLLPHRPGLSRQGFCNSHGGWPVPPANLETQGREVGLPSLCSSPMQRGQPCHFVLFISLFCSIWNLFMAFSPTFPPDNLPQNI